MNSPEHPITTAVGARKLLSALHEILYWEADMRVLLIDADSTIPNLPLMKLSRFYKDRGASVELVRLQMSYYPQRRITDWVVPEGYDRYFCSIVFPGHRKFIKEGALSVLFGGTGVDCSTALPDAIEVQDPDYSIYPENIKSYGFISRGCIRECPFCFVPKKEGAIRQVAHPSQIYRGAEEAVFMDNNFLALPNHLELLQWLINRGQKCSFNQGLDIRLVTPENSELLRKLNYAGEYTFAFDNVALQPSIERGLKLLRWRKDWLIRFFVYTHPSMPLSHTMKRISWLKEQRCLVYLMRDKSCWSDPRCDLYTDLAAWCNQPAFFKYQTFEAFLAKRVSPERRDLDLKLLGENK